MQEKKRAPNTVCKAAEVVKHMRRFTGQEKNFKAYGWAQKHMLHTSIRNSCFQGVCLSSWIRFVLEFQTQQNPS